jgi:phage terminase large subunit
MTGEISIDISLLERDLPLYESPKPITDLWGGRGRGGSFAATQYALYRQTRPDYCRIAFVRKILNDVRGSLWKDYLDRLEESNVSRDDFRIIGEDIGASGPMASTYYPTGNTINCFGVKADGGRTAKLKSLAGYNLVIVEEFDELTEDEANMLDDSLRTTKGEQEPMVIRVFNPPGRTHHIWKDYNLTESKLREGYWEAKPKDGGRVLSIFGTFKDNIENITPAKVEKWNGYQTKDPEYYYTMFEGLISEGQRGRIYSGWTPITFEEFQAVEAREIYGQDFGTVDPAAFGKAKFVRNRVYIHELNYKPLTDKEIAIMYAKLGITGKELIIGDKEDPITIGKLRYGWPKTTLTEKEVELYPQVSKGFYLLASIGGPGSIETGIKAVKDLEVYVTEESVNIWREYREYKWALDKDKNPTNTPEDKNNHHMDWIRNVVMARGRLF